MPVQAATAPPSRAIAEGASPGRSLLRELLEVSARPDILSLAGGLPEPRLFPVHEYRAVLDQVLATDDRALQYGLPFEPLKEQIVALMTLRGVRCTPEEILVTSGAQQALHIAARLLLGPYQPVLTEQATYPGLHQAVAPFRPTPLTVGTDLTSGLRVDDVADHLTRGVRPALIYVIPDGHNPYGISLALETRRRLVELAQEHRVVIVEDDPYGLLGYDGPHPPPLRALDRDWVVHIGTFSKTLAPALRLGWMVLPARHVERARRIKEAADLESSALTQRAVARYLGNGRLGAHLDRLRATYRQRRDTLIGALRTGMPSTVPWTVPRGGFFAWLTLPAGCDVTGLLREAIEEERLVFVPGHAFAADGGPVPHGIRLSFASSPPEQIQDGVHRLARLIERRLAHA